MKRSTAAVLMMLAFVLAAGAQKKSGADAMFQAARQKETVEGDLQGAIKQYGAIVSKHKNDRSVAATALVRMAECYQKLGDAESRKIFERVVREYGDQKEAVAQARAHLGENKTAAADVISRKVWTAPPRADFFGEISPDGRYLPYTAWADNGDLFVHDFRTGTERRLTDTATDAPGTPKEKQEWAEEWAFSRDSKQLAFTWARWGSVELRVINLQGSGIPQPRKYFEGAGLKWIAPYDWSPDGKTIAVRVARQDQSGDLALVSVADGSLKPFKRMADRRDPARMAFSPDGKYLAYDLPATDLTGQHDIFVASADGSGEQPVIEHPSHDVLVGWSTDGKRLLFASDRSGSMGLWARAFSNGKVQDGPELIRRDIEQVDNLGVTTSGSYYSAIYNPGDVPPVLQVATFDFAAGKFAVEPARAAQGLSGENGFAAWSPDGKELAFVSMRHHAYVAIGIRSMETGQVRELIPSPNFTPSYGYFRALTWAPDGGGLIVSARGDKEGSGMYRVDARTGRSKKLLGKMARGTVVSRDGKSMWFGMNSNDGIVVVKHDVASGAEKELLRTKYLLGGVNVSPDERHVALMTSRDASGKPAVLVVVPADGGQAREVVQRAVLGGVHFSPDSRYVATGTGDEGGVLLVRLENGEVKELMPGASQKIAVVSWEPDSRSVLIKRRPDGAEHAELWRAPADGGAPGKLDANVDHVAGGWLVSPDWRHAAFYMPGRRQRKPTEVWVLENLLR